MLIPKKGAGYSRVTHPFATNHSAQAPSNPFDLHVLSTPPAFVLSQDQTLQQKMPEKNNQKSCNPNQKNTNKNNLLSTLKQTKTHYQVHKQHPTSYEGVCSTNLWKSTLRPWAPGCFPAVHRSNKIELYAGAPQTVKRIYGDPRHRTLNSL